MKKDSYTFTNDEKFIFDWIDKVIEFLPEFKHDIFLNIMRTLECEENHDVINYIGNIMLKLNILEKKGQYTVQFSSFGRTIKEHGNYSNFLKWNEQQKVIAANRERIEIENLEYTIKVNKWLLRTKWLPHILSFLALVLAALAFFL